MILIANAVIEFISYVHMPCGNVAEIRAKVVVVCLSNRGNRLKFTEPHFLGV